MKKIFTLFAAVLMAGSMMAEHPNLIKFTEPAAAGSLNGQTFGSEFTLTITDTGDKVSVDANNCTFGLSAEESISFTHRLKTGGKSSSANKMTLVVPEEGMLVVYARPASTTATDRSFFITNGSDTIMNHLCLDTDTVEGASSKIFLPVIKENVPAGTYEVTYSGAINFYGFDMPALEEEDGPVNLATFFISSAEIVAGQVGDIALGTNGYGSQAVADPATWYTCAKGDYTFKGAKVCVAQLSNGGGIQMQGNANDAAKMGFFGNATAFNNIHSVKVVLRIASTATFAPVFNVYTDSLGTTTALAAPDTVLTTGGGFKKFVYTYSYATPGKFFNIKDDLAGALYIDTIYVTYEKEEEPSAWDGTVSLSKDTISSLADLEGITLTYHGAKALTLPHAMESSIALQNEDGSELYAMWAPLYGGTYVITDTVVTLTGWNTTEEFMVPLPAESATVYFEDYGSFVVDGVEEVFFETVEIAYNAAPAVTYNVNFSVVGNVVGETGVKAIWMSPDMQNSDTLAIGDNTVKEGNLVQVSVNYIEGYTVEIKVNDEAVALQTVMGMAQYWRDTVTADMTIVVTFTDTTAIEHLYIIGNIEGWDPAAGVEMTPVAGEEGVFTFEYSYASNGYFGFTTVQGTWDEVNAHRFGPAADGAVPTIGAENPNELFVTSSNAYQIPGGDNVLNVDIVKMTFIVEEKGPSALQNVDSSVKATKIIENGKVVIIKNGVKYNVLGAQF